MFVLHVELLLKAGEQEKLETIYRDTFRPAISAQGGFAGVQLLRPVEGDTNYRLTIAFDNQASQQKWVATDLHQQVWPLIPDCCTEFSISIYSAV